MSQASHHVAALQPTIDLILKTSGSVGASVGIIHHGEAYDAHFGFKNHEKTKVADSNTLYGIGSLSKSMMAVIIGGLVHKDTMSWHDTIQSVIPEFRTQDKNLGDNGSILDLLSMRSGLPTFNILWYQGNSYPLVGKSDLLPMVNGMTPSFPLRTDWRYSNWGYAVAGEIVKRKAGMDFPQQLSQSLFEPLGMNRTRVDSEWREDENVAQGFVGLSDASVIAIKSQTIDSSTIMAAAGGVCSTTKDLLLYYKALLAAMKDEIDGTSVVPHPFEQLSTIFKGHIPVSQNITSTTQYTLGWVKGTLPGRPGVLSPNTSLLKQMPIIGKGTKPQVFFSHTGSLAGFLSTAILVPESQTAVLVLVNTKPACDSSDLIANLVLDKLIGGTGDDDFVELTRSAMDKASRRYSEQSAELAASRIPNTSPKPLEQYEGRYYWKSRAFYVDVYVDNDILKARMVDRDDQVYTLEHYHFDTFTWLMTDEEEARRSRYTQATGAYKFVFETDEIKRITGFTWAEMGGGPGFFKKEQTRSVL